jgi:hypothetical protein
VALPSAGQPGVYHTLASSITPLAAPWPRCGPTPFVSARNAGPLESHGARRGLSPPLGGGGAPPRGVFVRTARVGGRLSACGACAAAGCPGASETAKARSALAAPGLYWEEEFMPPLGKWASWGKSVTPRRLRGVCPPVSARSRVVCLVLRRSAATAPITSVSPPAAPAGRSRRVVRCWARGQGGSARF